MTIENAPSALPTDALAHHISDQARRRTGNAVKAMLKFTSKPGVLSLAGGLPNPSFFSFKSLATTVPSPLLLSPEAPQTTQINDAPTPQSSPDLASLFARALQYSMVDGLPEISDIAKQIVSSVYRPAYPDWTVLPTTGNTDALYKTWMTFCNPGEGVLAEEWTYSVMLSSILPLGLRPVPVKADADGMSSVALRNLLENWDTVAPKGLSRPHTLYLVPVGQNPTGTVMSLQRKREIYSICSKYDIIIIEDDPYYFMQFDDYGAKANGTATTASNGNNSWPESLQPTFLNVDTDGRVIRLDSFSKTLAPGLRLGWVTCNKLFSDRIYAMAEVTSQAPSGFSQTAVCALWAQWGLSGYLSWLEGLRTQYRVRRDAFIDALFEQFDITQDHTASGNVLTCYDVPAPGASTPRRALFSFVAPRGGMFLWVHMHVASHPRYAGLLASSGGKHKHRDEAAGELMQQLWQTFLENNIVVMSGTTFCTLTYCGADRFGFDRDALTTDHVRISYSNFEVTQMAEAGRRFGAIVQKFFEL
ncbi:PLP-dependent transferase [Dentipellis sp. KUC8613]|nr:PLP-dependent transferase [Dentipellis sp. KUC8613]